MATLAPCSAKRTAIAWPMPELPPVTRTFLPFRPGMASVRVTLGAVAMGVSWLGVRGAVPGGRSVLRTATGAQLAHLQDHLREERLERRHSAAAAKGTLKRLHHTTTLR